MRTYVSISNDAHHTLPTDDTQKQETPHRQNQVHLDLGQEAVPYPTTFPKTPGPEKEERMRMGRCALGPALRHVHQATLAPIRVPS